MTEFERVAEETVALLMPWILEEPHWEHDRAAVRMLLDGATLGVRRRTEIDRGGGIAAELGGAAIELDRGAIWESIGRLIGVVLRARELGDAAIMGGCLALALRIARLPRETALTRPA